MTDGTYSKPYNLVITRAAYLPYQTYYATELTSDDRYISKVTLPTGISINSGDTYSNPAGAEGFNTEDASKTYRFPDGGGTMTFQLTAASSVAMLIQLRDKTTSKFTLSVKENDAEVGEEAVSTVSEKGKSEVVVYGTPLDVAKTYLVSITCGSKENLCQVRLGLSVPADETKVTLTGEVTATEVAELNAADKAVTCIDLTQCTSMAVEGLDLQNTNCLVVTKPGVTLTAAGGKHVNQVVYDEDTDKYTAEDI